MSIGSKANATLSEKVEAAESDFRLGRSVFSEGQFTHGLLIN